MRRARESQNIFIIDRSQYARSSEFAPRHTALQNYNLIWAKCSLVRGAEQNTHPTPNIQKTDALQERNFHIAFREFPAANLW
jgi:hypothetical protein